MTLVIAEMEFLLSDSVTACHYLDALHNLLPVEKKMEIISTLRTPDNIAKIRERWAQNPKLIHHIFEELGVEI